MEPFDSSSSLDHYNLWLFFMQSVFQSHFSEFLLLCSTDGIKSSRFGMTWEYSKILQTSQKYIYIYLSLILAYYKQSNYIQVPFMCVPRQLNQWPKLISYQMSVTNSIASSSLVCHPVYRSITLCERSVYGCVCVQYMCVCLFGGVVLEEGCCCWVGQSRLNSRRDS